MTVATLTLLLLAVIFGTAIQRVSGMGLSLLCVPVLTILIGPETGVTVANALAAVNAAILACFVHHFIDWRRLAYMAPALFVGILPALWLINTVSPAVLFILVGSLILLGLVTGLLARHLPHVRAEGRAPLLLTGGVGGFMSSVAGIAGPAVTVYALMTRWEHRRFAATLQPIFVISNTLAFSLKELTLPTSSVSALPWWAWLLCFGGMLVGSLLGSALAPRIPQAQARAMAITLAALGASIVVVRGISLL